MNSDEAAVVRAGLLRRRIVEERSVEDRTVWFDELEATASHEHIDHVQLWPDDSSTAMCTIVISSKPRPRAAPTLRPKRASVEALFQRMFEERWAQEEARLLQQVAEQLGAQKTGPILDAKQLDELRQAYHFESQHAAELVAGNDGLRLLVDAAPKLSQAFPEAPLRLEALDDTLYVVVSTSLDVASARSKLKDVEQAWWLSARGEKTRIVLYVDYV
jgi:hypothetical protein